MDSRRFDQLSRLLATVGTRRALMALGATLLGGLAPSGRNEATAIEHPHHPAHRVRQRKHHHRRKRAHEQQLDEQEQRQDDRDDRQDDKQQDDQGGGLGSSDPDPCGNTLRGAGCSFDGNRWVCPVGTHLHSTRLMECDLRNALLSRVDLSDTELPWTKLQGADLTGADLSFTNLTAANLSGAKLSGATLVLVWWSLTTCPDGTNSNDNGGACCDHLNGAVPADGC